MKKIIIPAIAIILLSLSLTAFIYEGIKKDRNITNDKNKIMIDGKNYLFPDKFRNIKKTTIEEKNGLLESIILKTKIKDPEKLKYTIIASDNYQKTVSWDDLNKGIITEERNIIFEHLPKGFWIKDVIKIEITK